MLDKEILLVSKTVREHECRVKSREDDANMPELMAVELTESNQVFEGEISRKEPELPKYQIDQATIFLEIWKNKRGILGRTNPARSGFSKEKLL